jgi:hypothetical protein
MRIAPSNPYMFDWVQELVSCIRVELGPAQCLPPA